MFLRISRLAGRIRRATNRAPPSSRGLEPSKATAFRLPVLSALAAVSAVVVAVTAFFVH